MYNIRKAVIKDSSIILNFIREFASFVKLEDQFIGTEEGLNKGLFGANPKAEALILEENNIAVGYALYVYTYSTFLCKEGIFIEDIYISQEYRGKGYGKAFLKHICSIAQQNDYGRVEWTCLDWNKDAINFYLKLGAKTISDKSVYRLTKEEISKVAGL
jgi:GNAT superfamily N-acetyltransferase